MMEISDEVEGGGDDPGLSFGISETDNPPQ